jgi:Trk K+ transport system NAD-binding subunit/nucleotide-binding universal stress UspA family protein
MKILICGAGRLTDELLKRFSENWQITLLDKVEQRLAPFSQRFPSVNRVVTGDASSPVVLDEAGLEDQDYVLALTDDDRVNHAVAKFAREKKIRNIMAVVRDPDMLARFNAMEIWTVPIHTVVARKIYQQLQDPRVNVTDLGQGEGELLEMELAEVAPGRPRRFEDFNGRDWRLVGLLRDNRLIFPGPSTEFVTGDRLLILGKSDLFKEFCEMLECDQPHFPMTYGQVLILGLLADDRPDKSDLLNETVYLAQNTKIGKMTVVCEKAACRVRDQLEQWSQSLDIEIKESGEEIASVLPRIEDAGLVVVPPLPSSFFQSLRKSAVIDLAHALACPLLVAKATQPYEKIMVPFDGSPLTEQALRTAIDLAEQIGARVTAVVVEEPDFITGEETGAESWRERVVKQVRSLAHIHKAEIEEMVREGNPAREILDAAVPYNLMIIVGSRREKGLFSPNVGDILVRKSPCSVLILTP